MLAPDPERGCASDMHSRLTPPAPKVPPAPAAPAAPGAGAASGTGYTRGGGLPSNRPNGRVDDAHQDAIRDDILRRECTPKIRALIRISVTGTTGGWIQR